MWYEGRRGFFSEMTDHLGLLLLLNLMWCLCCLPVVTIGAATTALHRVNLDILEEGGRGSVRNFWKYFAESFGRSTLLWAFLVFVAVDVVLLFSMAGISDLVELLSSPIATTAAVMFVMLYWFVMNWSFPLVAFGGGKGLMKTLGEAFSLAVSFPGKTFLCMGITVLMVLLSILCPLILLGTASCTSYLVCRVLRPSLRRARNWQEEAGWE